MVECNGEYPVTLMSLNKNCKKLCAENDWCLGIENKINSGQCSLVTDKSLYENATGKKIKKEWGYEENINGSKFIVYCDVQEECDKGYITFRRRDGYTCQVKSKAEEK